MSKKIFLDAGHGGNDPGAVNQSANLREADIVFEVCNTLKSILERAGILIMLSRPAPTDRPSINQRATMANAWGADYFISVHVNAGGGTGAETFIAATKQQDRAFAAAVNDPYAAAMDLRNRGVKLDTQAFVGSLGVLRQTRMPAILVELAFLDAPQNQPDIFILQNRRYEMADSLAQNILRYLDLEKELPSLQPPPAAEPPEKNVNFSFFGERIVAIDGYIENGVTWVRARQLAEEMGYNVGWNGEKSIVEINRPEPTAVTAEELDILQRIVWAEARGEDLKGQILVVNVVLNRVNSSAFPHHNTIQEVVFAPNQFEPTRNGAFERATPDQRNKQAVEKALQGVDYSQGALFFNAVRLRETSWAGQNRRHLFDHGGHSFYE